MDLNTPNLDMVQHQLIENSERFPDHVAVNDGKRQLSYQQLATGAKRVALEIAATGGEHQQNVGLFMAKSVESIASIYGVLMAGCVYVPLDVKNPSSRIQYIMDQCDINILLTTTNEIEILQPILVGHFADVKVIVIDCGMNDDISQPEKNYIDSDATSNRAGLDFLKWHQQQGGSILRLSEGELLSPMTLEDIVADATYLAAILFTSGSTGKPKGVMIEHTAISTFVDWSINQFQLNENDICISHAPINFDLSLFDIFATLSAGAELVLIPDAMSANPRFICQLMSCSKATIWQSVPSALILLMKYGGLEKTDVSSIRHVLFAGEKMATPILSRLMGYFNNADFHNIYGATETNDSFIHSIANGATHLPDPLPIGKPLPYVSYLIEDTAENNMVASSKGKKGLLLVKSATMMRGYIRRKSRPRSGIDCHLRSDHYYATGDIVEQQEDGSLLFCGRIDDIVKVSGYRVSLTEIQTTLLTHPLIIEAALFALTNDDDSIHLVAYVFLKGEHNISSLDLKIFAATKLARYAIPHQFVVCNAAMPKTTSGKIDKHKLYKRENSCQTVND